jgi:ubiquinone/menaquinone biosynthesis C-methylase UbiE
MKTKTRQPTDASTTTTAIGGAAGPVSAVSMPQANAGSQARREAGLSSGTIYGRLFARVYDGAMKQLEREGGAELRHNLLAQARGRTLELGAGTGLNLEHYPEAISELTLTEPDPHMLKRLRCRLEDSGRNATIIQAPAERLPFKAGAIDTVVSTWTLCTVDDPKAVMAEVARVLTVGGRFLFLEHVRSEDSERTARWQDRVTPLVRRTVCGCRPNRRTLATIEASPLDIEHVRWGEQPQGSLPWEKPMIVGIARKTSS